MTKKPKDEISQLAEKVMLDPLLLRKLSEKVYELMQEDIRVQRDRDRNYQRLI
ncbi:MAG TPA: hypothetical protein V6D28_15995 [Leptolyngbyaceae cyanobacterium]